MFNVETDWGDIHFSKDIVRNICVDAVGSCGDNVVIHNFHGKGRNKTESVFQQKKINTTEDILLEGEEDALEITVYTVIRFGASISSCAAKIIEYIFTEMKKVFGVTPAKVTVINTGTASKDIIARHMEFYRTSSDEEIKGM